MTCPNCFQEHGLIRGACLLGVLLVVLEATLDRELTPSELERISERFDDDHFYDNHVGPMMDYLKTLITTD